MANSSIPSSVNQGMAHISGGNLVNGYYKQGPYSGGRSRNAGGRSGSRGRGKPAARETNLNVHPEWEDRIMNYLVHKTHPVKTMELARLVSVRSRKEVNPTLYSMDRRGLIRKHGMQPPTWVIADPPASHTNYNQNESHYSSSPGIYQHGPVSRTPPNFYANNRESYRGQKTPNNNYQRSKRSTYRSEWHSFCPPSHIYSESKNESLIYSHSSKDTEILSIGNTSSPNRLRSESCSPDDCEALETAIANYPHSGGYGQGYSGHFPVTSESKQSGKPRRRNCDNFNMQNSSNGTMMPLKSNDRMVIQQKKIDLQDDRERHYDGNYQSYPSNFMNYANHSFGDMPVCYHQMDREGPDMSRVHLSSLKKDSKDHSPHDQISPKRNSNIKACNSDPHDPHAKIISFLDKTMNGSAKSREIAKHTGLSLEETQKHLHSLCKKKIVTTIGEDIYIMAKNAASYETEIPAGKSSSSVNSAMSRQFSSGNRQPPAPPHVLLADNGINSSNMKSAYYQNNNSQKQPGSSNEPKSASNQASRNSHLPPSPHELLAKDPVFKGDVAVSNSSNSSKEFNQSSSSSSASLSSSTSKNSRWNNSTTLIESSRAPATNSTSTSSTTSFAPSPKQSNSSSKQSAGSSKQTSSSKQTASNSKGSGSKGSSGSKQGSSNSKSASSSKQRANSPKQNASNNQSSSQSNSNSTVNNSNNKKNSVDNIQDLLKNTSISSSSETTETKTPTLAEIKAAAVAQALADKAAEKGADKAGIDSLAPNLQITSESFAALNKNPVSALMEYAQQRHLPVEFKLLSHRGPSHRPLFKFAVILGKRQFPSMECNSKKDGKKEAADLTLRILIAEGQYQLENTVSALKTIPPAEMTHFDKMAALSHQAFNNIALQIPENLAGRKVIAALVMKRSPTDTGIVISVGTGNRCLTGDHLSLEGNSVNDSHAEIITRRGFLRYLYRHLLEYDAEVPNDLFEKGERSICRIKTNITFHLYISTAPCGDGALFSPRDTDSSNAKMEEENKHIHNPTFSSSVQGLLRTKVEGGEGTIPIDADFTEQTWDGIQRGERLRTMSCSDKICRWNVVGLQGALLSHFIEPIYLDSLTLGYLYDHGHLARAVCCRIERGEASVNQLLPEGYRLNHPWLGRVTACDPPRETQKTKSLSINWCYDDEKSEVLDGTAGICYTAIEKNLFSRLTKHNLYEEFKRVCRKFDRNDLLTAPSYNKAKMMATPFQTAKNVMLKKLKENNCGTWVSKPIEEEMFA
ncbi:double-stranded RNA-specific adenosine deaminase isoform X2 [Octopus bimaculoides]|uniref:A to I editase domain-containing protein n=1 Tax=Octopus bimaculoides TaxID=37653 RepID=A0A0L8HCC9_OCTBM|nr:double-stranded RNA-specific adenosine deaminase isoform X2 [Octopus bimaculoides]|eukprot:XP_014773875.1 PREDICTED: double-stranded RNA-specific adenosine deaminase-like isoform X1 [Octopus bimaculoides]